MDRCVNFDGESYFSSKITNNSWGGRRKASVGKGGCSGATVPLGLDYVQRFGIATITDNGYKGVDKRSPKKYDIYIYIYIILGTYNIYVYSDVTLTFI